MQKKHYTVRWTRTHGTGPTSTSAGPFEARERAERALIAAIEQGGIEGQVYEHEYDDDVED